ncbi:MAG TPA: threonine synthase [Candidatus Faecalibacterium intestinigallinarum]|uniref:Threonine synthase n=1 Tax=Candidatus Faecalibacterium intestinigallinarum TaxID=2838581 RepID=A0A9D1QAU0_9FIRM|nr:threonine synthase [Candidatus Faecalibacterium intestinigallinarum]
MNFRCTRCGATAPVDTRASHCSCGGLWQLDYTPPAFDLDLIDRSVWGLFRYRRFLPLTGDTWRDVTLGEGMTPLVPLDQDVLLKMDYYMPTLSFKDRGAAVLVAHMKSIGVEVAVQDSSGNAGNSVAAYCGRCGIACDIYVPEGTSPGKIAMIQAHGATAHVVPGSRDHCADVCRAQVELEGKYYANHVYNPFFYQGTKTYLYEVYEQLGRIPAHLFVPLGNGTLFLGVVLALEELLAAGCIDHFPKVIAIQSERCDPFVKAAAVHSSDPAPVTPTPTMAEGISIGVPMRGREILEAIYRYDMDLVTVPEDRILEARSYLARRGIYCEHTTAANLAAYWHYCDTHGKTPDSLLTMCGAGLKSDH